MDSEMRKDTPIDTGENDSGIILQDVERGLYDFKDEEREEDFFKVDEGLTPDIVREISEAKHDPAWMLDFRLKSLEIYEKLKEVSNGNMTYYINSLLKDNLE